MLTGVVARDLQASGLNTLDHFSVRVHRWVETRGNLETIARLKMIRVMVYRALAGSPLSVRGIASYPSGVPRALGPMVNQWVTEGNLWGIRIALTLLQVSRVIPGWKKVNTSTITNPPKDCPDVHKGFKSFVVRRYKPLRFGVGVPN